jgi:putative cell wall-binding protein
LPSNPKRARRAGAAALLVATAASGLAFPTAAGAAPADNTDLTLSAASETTVTIGKTGQAAAPWAIDITPGDTLTAGDQILITVDDADFASCAGGDTLTFTALPTVTVTGTATILPTLETSGGACGNDRLRLNVTGSGTAAIAITNVAYNVGAGAAPGPIKVDGTLNGAGINDATAPNAFASKVIVTANTPPKGAPQLTGGSYVISPVVLAEQTALSADDDLCVYFDKNIESTPAPAPAVAVSGGSDTATVTANTGNNSVFVNVTPSAPNTASTFTISNLPIETNSGGIITTTVKLDNGDETCDGDETVLVDLPATAGFVGFVGRLGGADRFATAELITEADSSCFNTVILARGDQFADALAASYVAGHEGAGILLTNTDSIPASTLNGLRNVGAKRVLLMGGTAAISDAVATQLDGTTAYNCHAGPVVPATTLTVQRLAGSDRFQTAQVAAEFEGLGSAGALDTNRDGDCNDDAKTAIVASGSTFADALAAGPLAYAGNPKFGCGNATPIPLLLTGAAGVPAATTAALTNLGIQNVIVVGGTAAVSDAAVAQLTSAGYSVRRIAGANRNATAVALGSAMIDEWGFRTGVTPSPMRWPAAPWREPSSRSSCSQPRRPACRRTPLTRFGAGRCSTAPTWSSSLCSAAPAPCRRRWCRRRSTRPPSSRAPSRERRPPVLRVDEEGPRKGPFLASRGRGAVTDRGDLRLSGVGRHTSA